MSYLLKLKRCIDAGHQDLAQALAGRFSEATIDYLSYGHFRLFTELPPEPHEEATLSLITDQALEFDARHNQPKDLGLSSCQSDLEALALSLEVRFEIEDRILTAVT